MLVEIVWVLSVQLRHQLASAGGFMDLSAISMNVQGQVVNLNEPVVRSEFFNRFTVTELHWSVRASRNYRLPSSLRVSACLSSSVYADPRVSDGGIKSKLAPEEGRKFSSSKIVKLEPIRTLLLDNYDSYTYNLFQLLAVINGVAPVVLKNDEISWEELKHLLYGKRAFHNVVISPGPGSPKRAADIGVCMQLLKECGDIPILGVCMGHQALGYAHGADVVHAPEPVHGRLSDIEHTGNSLFKNIPSGFGSGFKVVRYHSLMIDPASLPEDLVPIAWTVPSGDRTPGTSTLVPDGDLHNLAMREEDGNEGLWNVNGSSIQASHCAGMDRNSRNSFVFRAEKRCGLLEENLSLQSNSQQPTEVQIVRELNPSSANSCHQRKLTGHLNGMAKREYEKVPGSNCPTSNGTRVIMGVAHQSWPHYGVQFHPESVATAYGKRILENFCNITRDFWHQQPWKPCHSGAGEKVLAQQLYSAATYATDPQRAVNSAGDQCLQEINGVQRSCHQSAPPGNGCFPAVNKQLRVVWKKKAGLAREAGGSESIFCDLFGRGHGEHTFWLDSSTCDQGRARFSFMGGKGGPLWRQFTYKMCDKIGGQNAGILRVEDVAGHVSEQLLNSGFFDFLEEAFQKHTCNKQDIKDLPFDFCGGFIGYLGYELKVECGALLNVHSSPHPDAVFFLADQIVVVDHSLDDVYVVAVYDDNVAGSSGSPQQFGVVNGAGTCVSPTPRVQAEKWVQGTLDQILVLCQKQPNAADERRGRSKLSHGISKDHTSSQFQVQTSRDSYVRSVQKCLSYIRDGESYEVCLTTQLKAQVDSLDNLGLYLTLRQTNPAPYAAWLHFGEKGPRICCSSPERFLRLDQDGILEAKPIKGTMPRGASPQEDEDLRKQLQNSEKDLAENLMIVDLLRNDLGSVCEAGSVHVPSLMEVESYSTVHTLVSTVRGTKRPDMSPVACIRAAFPGGSMTGAPKLRTMEILDSIESSARGVYSGTIGFLSFNSSFDLNIVIRTLVMNEAEACIGAGGAVVALSDPEAEYEEMLLKTRAPIKAFSKFEHLNLNHLPKLDKEGVEQHHPGFESHVMVTRCY